LTAAATTTCSIALPMRAKPSSRSAIGMMSDGAKRSTFGPAISMMTPFAAAALSTSFARSL
jgi:hypothetical protein